MSNKKTTIGQKLTVTYLQLFYMTPSEITAKDIVAVLQENTELSIELWDSMNILEIVLPNQNSVDFEPVEVNFKDPSDISFVKNRGIKTIFAVSPKEADLNTILPYFELIISRYSGFLCADSADFTPVYAGSSKK